MQAKKVGGGDVLDKDKKNASLNWLAKHFLVVTVSRRLNFFVHL